MYRPALHRPALHGLPQTPPSFPPAAATPQVLLLQGLSASARADVLLGPHHEGGVHLINALKFVAARYTRQLLPAEEGGRERDKPRGVLGALGGQWDPVLDGGDPNRCAGCRVRIVPMVSHEKPGSPDLQSFASAAAIRPAARTLVP